MWHWHNENHFWEEPPMSVEECEKLSVTPSQPILCPSVHSFGHFKEPRCPGGQCGSRCPRWDEAVWSPRCLAGLVGSLHSAIFMALEDMQVNQLRPTGREVTYLFTLAFTLRARAQARKGCVRSFSTDLGAEGLRMAAASGRSRYRSSRVDGGPPPRGRGDGACDRPRCRHGQQFSS